MRILWNGLQRGLSRSTEIILILLYVLAIQWLTNLYPLERFPGWGHFRSDSLNARRVTTFCRAVRRLEAPALDPSSQFGLNTAGEHASPWAATHLLGLVMDARAALWTGQTLMMFLGGIGAFLYLRHLTGRRFVAFAGALAFLGVGRSIHFARFAPSAWMLYYVPLFLLMIHRALERKTAASLTAFALVAALAILQGNAFAFFIFPATAFAYTGLVAWRYYGQSALLALRRAGVLLLLCLLAGAAFAAPYLYNAHAVAESYRALRQVLPDLVKPEGVWQGPAFRTALKTWWLTTSYFPAEGVGAHLYAPAACYLAMLIAYVLAAVRSDEPRHPHAEIAGMTSLGYAAGIVTTLFLLTRFFQGGDAAVVLTLYLGLAAALVILNLTFREARRHVAVTAALVLCGLLMVAQAALFFSPAGARLFPNVRTTAWGVLQFSGQVNALPGLHVLAAFVCLGAIPRLASRPLKTVIYVVLIAASLTADLALTRLGPWSLSAPEPGLPPATRLVFADLHYLRLLPVLNALPLLLLALHDLTASGRGGARVLGGLWFLLALFGALFTGSLMAQWSANAGPLVAEESTRDAYRWRNYVGRQTQIDAIVDRSNPNFRTLYATPGWSGSKEGRDWRTVAETELHGARPLKVLFQYSEQLDDAYEGLLYGTFEVGGKGFRGARQWPPVIAQVAANLEGMRLMGVRHVIAYDQPIESAELVLKGEGDSEPYPPAPGRRLAAHADTGKMYIYELSKPLGVVFLADTHRRMSRSDAWKMLYEKQDFPWARGEVCIETDPPGLPAPAAVPAEAPPAPSDPTRFARILKESGQRCRIETNAKTDTFLVVSYLHRPFWRATVDGKPAPIYRAYGGLMSLRVPAGAHTVLFRYYPWDVYLGVVLTVLALVLPLGLRRVF